MPLYVSFIWEKSGNRARNIVLFFTLYCTNVDKLSCIKIFTKEKPWHATYIAVYDKAYQVFAIKITYIEQVLLKENFHVGMSILKHSVSTLSNFYETE